MIVPHSEEATYSLRIPLYLVQAAVVLLVLGVTGFCVLGYSYLKVAAEAREAETLRQLSRAQQEEIDALAIETQRMMEQVHAIDDLVELVTERLEIERVKLMMLCRTNLLKATVLRHPYTVTILLTVAHHQRILPRQL